MKPKILVVDDDMMMRSVLELYIEQAGFECAGTASDAKKALEIIQNTKIDIILMDIYLKGDTDGVALSKEIEKHHDIPIIFISADPDKEMVEKSISKNIYGYLHKPIHKFNFKSTVYFALAKHKMIKNGNKKK
jgi:response regulator of citrate/malate metabolism